MNKKEKLKHKHRSKDRHKLGRSGDDFKVKLAKPVDGKIPSKSNGKVNSSSIKKEHVAIPKVNGVA